MLFSLVRRISLDGFRSLFDKLIGWLVHDDTRVCILILLYLFLGYHIWDSKARI
jgi:hypothetical protein